MLSEQINKPEIRVGMMQELDELLTKLFIESNPKKAEISLLWTKCQLENKEGKKQSNMELISGNSKEKYFEI